MVGAIDALWRIEREESRRRVVRIKVAFGRFVRLGVIGFDP